MTDRIELRSMMEADLEFANGVRTAVGWNQTLTDWRRLLEYQPDGCFVAEWNGIPAGTATTTCYGTALAWIGMVLVHPEFRRRGIGRALLVHGLEFLAAKGIGCIKLDATPLGKPLYEKLGFREEWGLTRWERSSQGAGTAEGENVEGQRPLRPFAPADAARVDSLDRAALGVSRSDMLQRLARDSAAAWVDESESGEMAGFGMARPGSRAGYLGPIVAATPRAASRVIAPLLACLADRPVFWDIPDGNTAATAMARRYGFVPQRPLVRMFRGSNVGAGNVAHYYALADPAIG